VLRELWRVRYSDLFQGAADQRIAAWPLERKYVFQHGCKLIAENIAQQATRTMQPGVNCFLPYSKKLCCVAGADCLKEEFQSDTIGRDPANR
jgi:hypothetical protein